MKTKKPIIFLFAISFLFAGNLYSADAQNLKVPSDYSIKFVLSPSHLESGIAEHFIGYVYVLDKHGVPITPSSDVSISLSSDDATIASVPKEVIIKSNEEFASFAVRTSENSGKTTISASLNEKTIFQEIKIGTDETYLPDDLILELNLPTSEMHVNSEMPFSVYITTSDGVIVRAPNDIDIVLFHEDFLATPNSEILTIKEGEYYAWGVLSTHERTGNTFLRALHEETGLDIAKSIKISSTLPTAIQISVFPELIPAEIDRRLDIFVTVVDSEGNPTKTPEDIPLEFFSSEQYPIGETLADFGKSDKPMIKKGQFGYLLQEKFSLQNLLQNNILIGVTAEGYGAATDTFRTVGTSIEGINNIKRSMNQVFDYGYDLKNYQHTVGVYGLENIPSNSSAFFTYQLSIIEEDEDDDGITTDGKEVKIHLECAEEDDDDNISNDTDEDIEHNSELDFEERILYTVDCMDDDGLYPIQATENQYSDGYVQQINVISSDKDVAIISDGGKITSSYSFGTAEIFTGQKTGPVIISASVNGVGTGSFTTNVINTLEQKEVRFFSPTGEDSLIFDRDGFFDIFLIALDGNQRPKVMKETEKYLVTPTNGLIEIEKDTTFTFTQLRSDTFDVSTEETQITLSVEPIGEKTNFDLEGSKTFTTKTSSKIKVTLPLTKINSKHTQNIGMVQLVDFLGNPMISKFDVKSKITSSDTVIQIIDDPVIPAGASYTTFPIKTSGSVGTSIISASAKGINGTSILISTASSQSQFQIFTGGLADEINVDEPHEFKLFIEDNNADSVSNALIKIITDDNITITPQVIKTNSDGSAIVSITALEGPHISFDVIVTADGYAEGKKSFTVIVNTPEEGFTVFGLELSELLIYIVIGGILMVVIIVVMVLKRLKTIPEEEWDDDEEI